MTLAPLTVVSGDLAPYYKVVRADSLADAHKGVLVEADTMAGTFAWLDHVTHEVQRASLPPRSIKIVRK